jgi:hypothetical protein
MFQANVESVARRFMARRQTGRPVLVDLAKSSTHVKGGMGVNSEKYKGVLTSSGGVARPRPLCGLCWGSTLDDAPVVSCPASLTSRPYGYRGLTKHQLLLQDDYRRCLQSRVHSLNDTKGRSFSMVDDTSTGSQGQRALIAI